MPPKYVKKTYKKPAKKAYKPRPLAKKVASLSRQVALIKPEKKHQNGNIINSVGQCNGNFGAYLTLDMTPTMSQGTNEHQRIGSQICVTGLFNQLQITPQSANQCAGVIEIELWEIKGYPSVNAYSYATNPTGSSQNPAELIYNSNAFITNATSVIIDNNSLRNMDYASNFKLLRKKTVYFPVKNDSTTPATRVKTVKFGCKFPKGHMVTWNKNTSTITSGGMFMLVKSNIGNITALAGQVSTLNAIPVTAINTGFTVAMNYCVFYTDN